MTLQTVSDHDWGDPISEMPLLVFPLCWGISSNLGRRGRPQDKDRETGSDNAAGKVP
ncbi:MAG: hypothetical protein WD045_10750 [Pirellulaceae bacterium]